MFVNPQQPQNAFAQRAGFGAPPAQPGMPPGAMPGFQPRMGMPPMQSRVPIGMPVQGRPMMPVQQQPPLQIQPRPMPVQGTAMPAQNSLAQAMPEQNVLAQRMGMY